MSKMPFGALFPGTNNTETPFKEDFEVHIRILFKLMPLFLEKSFQLRKKNSSIGLRSGE